jgi:hypothetical protein
MWCNSVSRRPSPAEAGVAYQGYLLFDLTAVSGLPAVNIAYVNDESEDPVGAWESLAKAFEWFLLAGLLQQDSHDMAALCLQHESNGCVSEASPVADNDRSRSDAELEVAVLDSLTDSVLTSCPHTPAPLRLWFIQIVDRWGLCSTRGNERYWHIVQ